MEERDLLKQISEFENFFKLNTFEMLESEKKYSEEWERVAGLLLFSNINPFLFNKVNSFKAKYIVQDGDLNVLKKKVFNECDKKDGNIILITNKDSYYKGLIKRFNQHSKKIYLLTDDKEDIKMKELYENLIINYVDNVKKEFFSLKNNKKIIYV